MLNLNLVERCNIIEKKKLLTIVNHIS